MRRYAFYSTFLFELKTWIITRLFESGEPATNAVNLYHLYRPQAWRLDFLLQEPRTAVEPPYNAQDPLDPKEGIVAYRPWGP